MSEKLQKVLARAGLGSRRQLEMWIIEGRVRVNGVVAKLGDRVDEHDKIQVDDQFIHLKKPQQIKRHVLLYHKAEGEVCTRSDPENRTTVFENLPQLHNQRWIAIGRLDINTAGLLLFTNDGDLAHRLLHPSYEIEREYAVRVLGKVDAKILQRLREGVELEDGVAAFHDIIDVGGTGANHWYHVILKEGRKREVRRLWESQGITVSRLIRVRFGNIQLPRTVRKGKWQELTSQEIAELMQLVHLNAD